MTNRPIVAITIKLYIKPYFVIDRTRCQFLTPMFCPAILLTAVPSACAGNIMILSNRCEAPKPATALPPNKVTTLMIAADPAEMTDICNPDGIPNYQIKRTSIQDESEGT